MYLRWRGHAPATDDLALRLAYSDVISDNDELDAVGLVRVLRRILLLRKTEVQDISRVVSGEPLDETCIWAWEKECTLR